MVLIPPGEFDMGNPTYTFNGKDYGDEEVHHVVISEPFYIGKYEVTQEQWQSVMGRNPSWQHRKFIGPRKPVNYISWNDCLEFCEKTGFLIPTEAQWEYASRAGTATPFHFGRTLSTNQANVAPESRREGIYRGHPLEVGRFSPNAWGLHDMHGNISEFCVTGKDIWVGYCPCVLRGGYYGGTPIFCRSTNRTVPEPTSKGSNYGLRLVKTVE